MIIIVIIIIILPLIYDVLFLNATLVLIVFILSR